MNAQGLMLCDDLIFFSRVSGTARAAGFVVNQVRTADAMVDAAKQAPPNCVILDLQNEGLDLAVLFEQLREACPAMPRSQFAEKLEGSLKEWLGEARAVANVQNSE